MSWTISSFIAHFRFSCRPPAHQSIKSAVFAIAGIGESTGAAPTASSAPTMTTAGLQMTIGHNSIPTNGRRRHAGQAKVGIRPTIGTQRLRQDNGFLAIADVRSP